MKKTIIVFLVFLFGCTSAVIKFRVGNSSIKYRMDIPKKYQLESFAGDNELEKRFWYNDSSVIYITTFDNTMNYQSIREQGIYSSWFKASLNGDTITLQGIDSLGLYWKDINKGNVIIGYSKVNTNKKEFYDKILDTFRKR